MTDRKTDPTPPNATGNTAKDPEDWTTGDEPMTGAQRSYLKTLCDEANEPMDETLTKAQASERIAELQQRTGRARRRASRLAAGTRAKRSGMVHLLAASPRLTDSLHGQSAEFGKHWKILKARRANYVWESHKAVRRCGGMERGYRNGDGLSERG